MSVSVPLFPIPPPVGGLRKQATIAYLTCFDLDERSPDGPLDGAIEMGRAIVEAGGETFTVEIIAFGTAARQQGLSPGVRLRVLPSAFRPMHPLDVLSWGLPAALGGAHLVHIHQAFTRTAEMGLLIAKLLHKPVCVTVGGETSSRLGEGVDFLSLADCVFCGPDSPPNCTGGSGRAVRLDWDDPAKAGRRLARTYQRLLAGEEAACESSS